MDAYHKSPELPTLSGQAKVLRLYVPFTTVRRMCQGAGRYWCLYLSIAPPVGTAEIRLTDQIHPPWKHATVPDPKRHCREPTRVHTVLRQRRTCCYLSQVGVQMSHTDIPFSMTATCTCTMQVQIWYKPNQYITKTLLVY